jgi:uncharacterized protein (AIM24 family)
VKLVIDLARIFFARLAIMLLAALALVAVDAYRAHRAELEDALQRLEAARVDVIRAKQKLEAQISDARNDLSAIEGKMQWWRTPHPPPAAAVGGVGVYMAWWTLEHVKAINALEKQRAQLHAKVDRLQDAVSNADAAIARIADEKLAALTKAQLEGRLGDLFNADFVRDSLRSHKTTLTLVFLGLFFGPLSVKAISFYLLAPLAKTATPITLNAAAGPNAPADEGAVEYGERQKEMRIDLAQEESLLVKPGWYSLNTEGNTRTRFFWDGTKPFASYAMGLVKMTEFVPDAAPAREIRIGSEADPNHDIIAIQLRNHPGYVVKHGHVVATSGSQLRIEKRWRLWDWKSWLYGNLRYVFFTGTGAIYVHGYGAVSINLPTNPRHRIKERHVIGFDTRTSFRMIRTETFVGYWLDSRSLYDINFLGQGSFLQQQSFGRKDEKIFRSLLEDLLGAIGKVLGF